MEFILRESEIPADLIEFFEPIDPAARRDVLTVATKPFPEAHFATFPEELPELCIKAGCPEGGIVLDPFAGSGTTLLVAQRLGRIGWGIELKPEYADIAARRLAQEVLPL